MDFEAVEAGLLDWASVVTGVERACCQWENEARVQDNGRLCLLSWVSSVGFGTDDRAWVYAANADPLLEMTPVISGPRSYVLQISVECIDQRSGHTARASLERARERIQAPSALARLKALDLAYADLGTVLTTDYAVDDHLVSRCTLDVTLNASGSFTDTDGRTSYIATLALSSTVTRPDGSAAPSAAIPGGTIP